LEEPASLPEAPGSFNESRAAQVIPLKVPKISHVKKKGNRAIGLKMLRLVKPMTSNTEILQKREFQIPDLISRDLGMEKIR